MVKSTLSKTGFKYELSKSPSILTRCVAGTHAGVIVKEGVVVPPAAGVVEGETGGSGCMVVEAKEVLMAILTLSVTSVSWKAAVCNTHIRYHAKGSSVHTKI